MPESEPLAFVALVDKLMPEDYAGLRVEIAEMLQRHGRGGVAGDTEQFLVRG